MTIPHPIRIKICGLSRPEDIACANDVRPDFVGFVFAPASRRCITPERAAALRAALLRRAATPVFHPPAPAADD